MTTRRLRDWWVISTALCPPTIELECRRMGWRGQVTTFTKAEWRRAYHAPSEPYPWAEHERVEVVL